MQLSRSAVVFSELSLALCTKVSLPLCSSLQVLVVDKFTAADVLREVR